MAPGAHDVRPLRRDAERNRRRILDAAGAVVAERGLAAGFDEIARRAGVGVGTVYRRFPDREDLVAALFTERIDQMVQLAARAGELADPWEGLVWFFESTVERQASDRGFKEVLGEGPRGRELLDAARERIQPAVGALVDRAHASGQLRPDVDGLDLGVLANLVSEVAGATAPELWRRYAALALDGVRARSGLTELPPRPPEIVDLAALFHHPPPPSAPS